uniref:Uncharacterized protein n=1 Tax=Timema bartmani TaxID=61472 RepID=A0A7R9ELH2_9NEOP|nr:unnamed protein product [Timema bartmani]
MEHNGVTIAPYMDILHVSYHNDIIIIDDEDEQFPSSQIFDSSPDPEENKASITEENKIDEFEDDLFQPENDLASSDEDEWFSKLSQNDKIENSSALEEQRLEIVDGLALKNIIEEDSEEEIFSVRKQNSVKRTILDDEDEDEDEDKDNHDDESNESFTFGLPNDFRNDAQELDEKSKPPLEEISKSNEKFEKKSAVKLGKSLLIDAPPMPPRRASNRGISIAEAERLYNDKATLVTLYSHHELQGTKIPRTGDLVALELSLDSENSSEGGRRFTNTFGYLTATNLQTLNDHSIVICHIRPYLRVFQALENLKNSPLRNYILNPSAQNINYPKVNETLVAKDILNEAQRRTVLQLASVCRGEGQGVYLIQGPPGKN